MKFWIETPKRKWTLLFHFHKYEVELVERISPWHREIVERRICKTCGKEENIN